MSKVIEQANCSVRVSKPGNLGPESLFLKQHYTALVRTLVIYHHILYISQGRVGGSVCVWCGKEGIRASGVGAQPA